ncbi:MAG TPA: multiheme c-type cytochrome [Allosphingosinicella sp.]
MGRSRNLAIGSAAGALLLSIFLLILVIRPTDASALQNGSGFAHVGVASCAGSTCHGRSEADGKIVRQDELRSWQDESSPAGAHSRAWRVLTEPRSRAIAARLGIGQASSAPMCLGCHAAPVAQSRRGPRFQLSDGVGCESCHGAAGGWLASHYAVGGTHASNVSRGMVPLEDPRARASVCLDCHYGGGDPGQFVNHRIMAAGHPRLSFELDLFSTLQQHHNEDGDYVRRKGRSDGVRMWAVGQTMALERSLGLFSGPRGAEGIFPEFYFFDCHTCHRRISDDPRFDPDSEANPGRPIPAGMPAFNDENMIMLSAAARIAAPGLATRFDRDSRAFHAALARDRGSAVAAAAVLRESARALGSAFSAGGISRAQTFEIIDSIAGNAVSPRFTDYAGSVQAVMAVDTLLSSLVSSGAVSDGASQSIRSDINAAYRAVRDPNAFNARDFRASLGRAAAAIRRLK